MIRSIILIVGLVFLSIGYGCSPASVIASGGATTMVVAEGDKSFGTAIDDKIRKQALKILKKYTLTETVEIVHKLSNISKKDIYKMAIELKND